MWSKPWSYKEGLVIGAGLLVIGILLQMADVYKRQMSVWGQLPLSNIALLNCGMR